MFHTSVEHALACSSRVFYFPMQNVEKIRFNISSAVVAPVIASIGRNAAYRSSSASRAGSPSPPLREPDRQQSGYASVILGASQGLGIGDRSRIDDFYFRRLFAS